MTNRIPNTRFGVLLCPQVKNAGRKLGRRCDMCSNYEKQLQAIQGQEAETRDQVCLRRCGAEPLTSGHAPLHACSRVAVVQVKKLQVMLRQANDQLERTMAEKQSLEDSVKAGNEETASKVGTLTPVFAVKLFYSSWIPPVQLLCVSQVSSLLQRVQASEALLGSLQQAFTEAKRTTQEQMVSQTFC